MSTRSFFIVASAALVAVPLAVLTASGCGSSKPTETADSGTTDTGTTDTGTPDAGPTCFTNPTTHLEIINACTDAQAVDKTLSLPLLLADGGLPPLP